MKRMPVFSLLVCLLLTQPVFARNIYVNNAGGDDLFDGAVPDGTSQGSGPYKTIAKALRSAKKGDRIVLVKTGVPYRESITLQGGRNSGFARQPFVIDGGGAILDGSKPVPNDAWEHHRDNVYRFQPKRQSHQQLFIDDKPVNRVAVPAAGKFPQLKQLEWCLLDRHIYFRPADGKMPDNYRITCAGQAVGITLYQVRNVVIENVTVQGFQLDGINALDSAFEVSLVGITARGNGRSGVSVGGSSRVTLRACLLGNNGTAQLRSEGWSHSYVVDCDILDNTAPAVVRKGGKVHIEKTDQPTDR